MRLKNSVTKYLVAVRSIVKDITFKVEFTLVRFMHLIIYDFLAYLKHNNLLLKTEQCERAA